MFDKSLLKKLAVINLQQRPFRSFLAGLSITIGTACLLTFLGLSNGIQEATFSELEKSSPLNQIVVTPGETTTNVISLFNHSSSNQLTEEDISNLEAIPGVKNIDAEIQFNSFASVEGSILGMSLVTDTIVFGLPTEFLAKEIDPKLLERTEEPYPVVIPSKLLDLYNVAIATPQNLPKLAEENLIGKELTLFPNFSTFFPFASAKDQSVSLEVVGFSDKVNLIGLTLPSQVVRKFNSQFASDPNDKYLELFVEVEDASQTTNIAAKIETLGFKTEYFQKNLAEIEAKFTYLKFSLGIISLIILFTAAIAIMSTFLATVSERSKEIGLFRALGAKKSQIRSLILFEAGIVGIVGSIVGILAGFGLGEALNSYALNALAISSFDDDLFKISKHAVGLTFLFGFIITILTAYLPARRAANTDPIVSLKK